MEQSITPWWINPTKVFWDARCVIIPELLILLGLFQTWNSAWLRLSQQLSIMFSYGGLLLFRCYNFSPRPGRTTSEIDRTQRWTNINVLRNGHRAQFPLTDNLMCVCVPGTSRPERESTGTFCDEYVLRQVDMAQYTYLQVKQTFVELFCATRTGITDPTIRHVQRSPFWSPKRASMTAKLDNGQ